MAELSVTVSVSDLETMQDLHAQMSDMSVKDALTTHPDEFGRLFNTTKDLAKQLKIGNITVDDPLSADRQRGEPVFNYMYRLAGLLEKQSSLKESLTTRPELLGRYISHIPNLLTEGKAQIG